MAGTSDTASDRQANETTSAGVSGADDEPRKWSDIVLALIPAEVTAVYLGIRSTVAMIGQSAEDIGAYVPYALAISIVVLCLMTPLYASRIRGTSLRAGSFIALSFLIWAANIDYDRVLEIIHPTEQPLLYAVASYVIPISIIAWGGLAVPIFAHSLRTAKQVPERADDPRAET